MIAVSEWQVELYITIQVCLGKYMKINYVIGKGRWKRNEFVLPVVRQSEFFCCFTSLKDCIKMFFQVKMSAKTESVLRTMPVILMTRCSCFPASFGSNCRSAYPFTCPG